MKFNATVRKEGAADQTSIIEAPSRFAVYDQVAKNGGTVVKLEEGGGSRFKLPAWLTMTIGTG
ncbi:MAG TPA: hypothetical protein VJI70_01775, partial [Candidatus Paceibacterota bacterium]